MPGKKTVRWDDTCRETIMAARAQLVADGMTHPTIRSVLYKLLELPGWDKRHYDTLCVKLGEWRDAGLIEFGLFSDDGAGDGKTPWTSKAIAEQMELLSEMVPAKLGRDGFLHCILVEHVSLVRDVSAWCDHSVGVVSSQGQLRRENLYTHMRDFQQVAKDLGAEGIKMIGLVDYDKGGSDIFGAHQRWLKKIFGVELTMWGVTAEQIKAAGLPLNEDHQIDGWVARYGPKKVRLEIRRALNVGGS